MKLPIIVTTTLLTTICLTTPATAADSEHTRQLLATKECQNCDLSGAGLVLANLSGANLSGADLSGANLSRANLSGADLSGANLNGASLFGANLSGAKLSGAELSTADLRDSYLANTDLTGANLSRANLQGAVGIPLQVGKPEDFYRWGVAQGQKGNSQGAIEHFNQALTINPSFAAAYLARGAARYQQLDRAGAIRDAQVAEKLFLAQKNPEGYQTAQLLVTELQAPQGTTPSKGKPNFMNFLAGLGSILLRTML